MTKMRLRAIQFGTDFRKNEMTIFRDFFYKNDNFREEINKLGNLRKNDVFLFISKSMNQLLWVLNYKTVLGYNHVGRKMLDVRKWRISGGIWHPWMLSEYAKAVDVELIGIRSFETQMQSHKDLKKLGG